MPFLLLLTGSPLRAQPTKPRELTLKVILSNPNNRPGRIFTARHVTKGFLNCSGYALATRRDDFTLTTCTARSDAWGVREVAFSGHVEEGWPGDEEASRKWICEFNLQVHSGSHDFKAQSGCSLNQDWRECGRTGPCTATVKITIK